MRTLEAQGGHCAICPSTARLVVDHNHKTNALRGILCHRCNVRLAAVEDLDFKNKAENYLAKLHHDFG